MHTMTQERDGFSLAHRAALMSGGVKRALATVITVAVIASLAVVGSTATSYAQGKKKTITSLGMENSLVVTNNGALLGGNVEIFAAGVKGNERPQHLIQGSSGGISLLGVSGVPTEDVLAGVAVNPNPISSGGGPSVANAIYAASDLSILGTKAKPLPDVVAAWAPGASGNSNPIVFMLTLAPIPAFGYPGNPLSLPEGIAFIPGQLLFSDNTSVGLSRPPGSPGDFYVTNYTGGPGTGSVLEYQPDAGSATDPLASPLGQIQDTVKCTSDGEATGLLGPVGVALDSSNNIWVVNSGFGSFPSYVTEYPAGSSSDISPTPTGPCVFPIDITSGLVPVGFHVLEEGEFDAISPVDGSLWVSDLKQNAIYQFDVTVGDPNYGAVLTTIAGKHSRLKAPMGIALGGESDSSSSDDLYVANNVRNSILMFEDPAFSGLLNVKPAVQLKGNRTKLNLPVGVALSTGVPAPIPLPR
jgi:hypothetical protein